MLGHGPLPYSWAAYVSATISSSDTIQWIVPGRPKATPEEIDLLAKIKSLSPKAVTALESVLDDPNATADAKIKAANIVIERQLGKPRQEIDQNVTQHQASPEEHKPDLSNLRLRAMQATTDPATLSPADGKPSIGALPH